MRRIMSTLFAAASVLILAAAFAPAGAYAGSDSPHLAVTQLQDPPGKALFEGKGNCFTCHKADATGTPLAPDLTDDAWINFEDGRPTQEAVETLIREGVASPVQHPAPMPPMGGASLSDEEVTQLAEYVLSLTAE